MKEKASDHLWFGRLFHIHIYSPNTHDKQNARPFHRLKRNVSMVETIGFIQLELLVPHS